jgi:hypothetical protein
VRGIGGADQRQLGVARRALRDLAADRSQSHDHHRDRLGFLALAGLTLAWYGLSPRRTSTRRGDGAHSGRADGDPAATPAARA